MLYAQSDTLAEVVLEDKIIVPKGYKKEQIQSNKSFHVSKLSDLLVTASPIYIKQYGASNLATSSVRGMNASHTQVLWNGIPLSSPSLGQADLSQIHSSAFDKISVVYGGGEFGAYPGAIGATIFLDKQLYFEKRTQFSMSREFASYQRNSGYSSLSLADTNYYVEASIQTLKASNDFEFYNTRTRNYESRQNAEAKSIDFQANLGYKLKANQTLNLGVWMTEGDQQVPRNIQIDYTGLAAQKQSDESKRWFLSWELKGVDQRLILKTAYLESRNIYEDKATSLGPSSTYNYSYFQQLRYLKKLPRNMKLHFGLDLENQAAETSTYDRENNRKLFTVSGGLDYDRTQDEGYYLSYKLLFPGSRDVQQIYSLAARKVYSGFSFSGHLARSFRSPSLNDLYWAPGGNPNLEPEKGWNLEWSVSRYLDSAKKMRLSLNNYHHIVDNWIMWQPSANGNYWEAQNVQKVYSRGLEIKFQWDKLFWNRIRSKQVLQLGSGRSEIRNSYLDNSNVEGKDLIYTPRYTMQYVGQWSYKDFRLRWRTSLNSKVYTSTDNTTYMPGFSLSNLDITFTTVMKEFTAGFNLGLDNVFDIDYQVVANQPMPGRTFHLGLSLQVSK
jgi:iron complex outermembrane receptor protein